MIRNTMSDSIINLTAINTNGMVASCICPDNETCKFDSGKNIILSCQFVNDSFIREDNLKLYFTGSILELHNGTNRNISGELFSRLSHNQDNANFGVGVWIGAVVIVILIVLVIQTLSSKRQLFKKKSK